MITDISDKIGELGDFDVDIRQTLEYERQKSSGESS